MNMVRRPTRTSGHCLPCSNMFPIRKVDIPKLSGQEVRTKASYRSMWDAFLGFIENLFTFYTQALEEHSLRSSIDKVLIGR